MTTIPQPPKKGDKLVISTDAGRFAIEATLVTGVVEAERFFMLPVISRSRFSEIQNIAKGVITMQGEVVIVIDLDAVFNLPKTQQEPPYRVVVTRKGSSCLGLLAGRKGLTFIWNEDLEKMEFMPSDDECEIGWIDTSDAKISLIDWQKLVDKSQELLAA